MSSPRPDDMRLWQMLECCRPGSDDLADPGLAEAAARLEAETPDGDADRPEWLDAFQRMQKLDGVIAAAIHDVPLPGGLKERLLARLVETAVCPQTPAAAPAEPRSRGRGLLRWAAAAAVAVGTAACLTLGLLWWIGGEGEFSAGLACEQAVELFLRDDAHSGSLASEVSAWGLPPSRSVVQPAGMRWRWVEGFLGGDAVAYDLSTPDGPFAVLYVSRQTVTGLADAPGARPDYSTANCSVGAWREGGLVYVLVVRGGAAAFEQALNIPRGPVA